MSESTIELPDPLERILSVIVHEHRSSDSPVSSPRIADLADRHPGTVRNQMPKLVSFGVVDSVRGPEGGYVPTERGLDVLGYDDRSDSESTVVAGEQERVRVAVDEIELTNVRHPTTCRAHVRLDGTARHVEVGDPVLIGPTPVTDFVIGGRVLVTNETADEVLIDVSHTEAPFTDAASADD